MADKTLGEILGEALARNQAKADHVDTVLRITRDELRQRSADGTLKIFEEHHMLVSNYLNFLIHTAGPGIKAMLFDLIRADDPYAEMEKRKDPGASGGTST